MKKKFLIILITIFIAALCALCVTACNCNNGKDGASGVNVVNAYIAEGDLYLVLSDGSYVNCGKVVGSDGTDGENGLDGVGIVDIVFNKDGELVIRFASGEERNIGVSPKICVHRYGDWVVETEANCVTQGYKYCVCEECGFMINQIEPATGHNWDERNAETVIAPETCTDEGWKLASCTRCRETKLMKIEAVTHDFAIPSYNMEEDRYITKCLNCDMREPSKGLEYKVVGNTYHLTSLGECTDSDIVVADVIETQYGLRRVTAIDYGVFTGQEITSVYLSKYIDQIDHTSGSLFGNEYCEGMTHLVVHPKNPVYRSDGNCIVDIQNKSVIAGCTVSAIPSDGSVTTVGAHAFDGVTKLTKIVIPDKIVTLGASAFANCTGLTSLTLGGSLNTIGTNCFYQCTGLETVKLNAVPIIGQWAFASCFNLEEVWLNNGCERVGNYAFVCCMSLTTVHIAGSVWGIGKYAFGACGSLTDLRFAGTRNEWYNQSSGVGVADEDWNATPPLYQGTFTDTPITNADIKTSTF